MDEVWFIGGGSKAGAASEEDQFVVVRLGGGIVLQQELGVFDQTNVLGVLFDQTELFRGRTFTFIPSNFCCALGSSRMDFGSRENLVSLRGTVEVMLVLVRSWCWCDHGAGAIMVLVRSWCWC